MPCDSLTYALVYKQWHMDQLRVLVKDLQQAPSQPEKFSAFINTYLRSMEKRIQSMSDRELYAHIERWANKQFKKTGYLPGLGKNTYVGAAKTDFPTNMAQFLAKSLESLDPEKKQSIFTDVAGNVSGGTVSTAGAAWDLITQGKNRQLLRSLIKEENEMSAMLALEEMKVRLRTFKWGYFPKGVDKEPYLVTGQKFRSGTIVNNGYGVFTSAWTKSSGVSYIERNLRFLKGIEDSPTKPPSN